MARWVMCALLLLAALGVLARGGWWLVIGRCLDVSGRYALRISDPGRCVLVDGVLEIRCAQVHVHVCATSPWVWGSADGVDTHGFLQVAPCFAAWVRSRYRPVMAAVQGTRAWERLIYVTDIESTGALAFQIGRNPLDNPWLSELHRTAQGWRGKLRNPDPLPPFTVELTRLRP